MKLFKQKFTSILLAAAFLVGAVSIVNFALKTEAASQTAGDLTIEYPSAPLFDAHNIAPGYEEVKTITVTNTGTVPHNFSLAISGTVGDLGQVIQFEPRNFDTKMPYWNHTLSEIVASPDGFVILSLINPSQTVKIDLAAILPESVGNDYMNKSVTAFGIIFGVDSSFESPIIPVFGPEDEETGGTTGVTSGGSTLTYGGSSVGSAGPGGTLAEDQTIAETTDQPEETGIVSEQAETKGEETTSKIWCYWWLVLLIVYAVFLIVYGVLNYNANGLVLGWMWPIFGGAVLYLVHWILHDYYTPVKWCDYFVWFELILLAIYYIFYRYLSKRKEPEEK